jgi:outer membrane biosynthesis protein TonB
MENEYLSDLADISPSLAFVTRTCLAIYRGVLNISLAIRNSVMGAYLLMCMALTIIRSFLTTVTDRICDAWQRTIQYLGYCLSQLSAISLAYYCAIIYFDLLSWAFFKRFWISSWSFWLNLVYQACSSTGAAINILGIKFTSYLLDAYGSIKSIAKSAKKTILPTLLPLMGLVLSIALYQSDADFFNIISAVFIMAINIQIYIVSLVFDIIHVIAVVCVLSGEFFYWLADVFTTLHTYSQTVVYEDFESIWFMGSTAIMSYICSVLVFAMLYLATRLVASLTPRDRSSIERLGTATVHEVDNVEENESSQPSQNSDNIGEQVGVSEEIPPTTEQAEEVPPTTEQAEEVPPTTVQAKEVLPTTEQAEEVLPSAEQVDSDTVGPTEAASETRASATDTSMSFAAQELQPSSVTPQTPTTPSGAEKQKLDVWGMPQPARKPGRKTEGGKGQNR